MVLISFEYLLKIHTFSKFEECSSKIVPAMPIKSSKLKWAWQAWFFSHAPGILEKCVFFKDLQIILVPFFYILTGFRFRKNTLKSDVHSLRHPCLIISCCYGSTCLSRVFIFFCLAAHTFIQYNQGVCIIGIMFLYQISGSKW